MSPASHKYEVGTRVFCFEPDPSKAKLIYHAKITQLCGFTSSGRSRVPLYFVHFLGWKQKWDREVSEDLLMDINHFTKMLKRKIDELALNVKDKEKRKERIDTVLMNAAKAQDDVDWDSLPGTWQKDEQPTKSRSVRASGSNDLLPSIKSTDSNELNQAPQSDSTEDADEDPESNFESLPAHDNFAPNVRLTETLKAILKSHCRASLRPIAPTPSWCSVLHLLQTYLNGFPYFMPLNNSTGLNRNSLTQFPSTVFRERFSKAAAAAYAKADRSKRICADFCCSVQILFDALMEQYFLLPGEENRQSNSARTTWEEPPRGLRYSILPTEEINRNPCRPCLTYGSIYILRLLRYLPALIGQMRLSRCSRSMVLRHLNLFMAYLEDTHAFWFTATHPTTPTPPLASNTVAPLPLTTTTAAVAVKRTSAVETRSTSPPPARKRRRVASTPVTTTTVVSGNGTEDADRESTGSSSQNTVPATVPKLGRISLPDRKSMVITANSAIRRSAPAVASTTPEKPTKPPQTEARSLRSHVTTSGASATRRSTAAKPIPAPKLSKSAPSSSSSSRQKQAAAVKRAPTRTRAMVLRSARV